MIRHRLIVRDAILSILCLLPLAKVSANQPESTGVWPQWRGPNRDAKVVDAAPWPGKLDGLNRTWRMELGPGYSGPIVTPDRVFVTETVDRKFEVVRALNRLTGETLWETRWEGAMEVPFFAKANGDWIRSTPAWDGESLFVAGMRDVLVCLNEKTGDIRWRVDFVEKLGTDLPPFGFVCSPLVDGEFVFVQAGSSFAKLNKRTGEVLWRILKDAGGMESGAFSSPILASLHGKRQLVVQTRKDLAGVDPESGDILWSTQVPAFRGMNILTPTVFGNGIWTSTHKNKTFFYRVDLADGKYTVNDAWTHKAQGYMSSPIVLGNFGYLHLGNGRLACFDLSNGEEKWRTQGMGDYWSMVANGRRILALNDEGKLFLFDANPTEFKLLDEKKVSDQDTWGHLAVAGGQVFVRELNAISVFNWK